MGKQTPHIRGMAEDFENCSQNGGRVGYLPLESNISNWLQTAYLNTKEEMHCQTFTPMKGHVAGVMVGTCMRMEMFFCFFLFCFFLFLVFFFCFFFRFDPRFFPPFSLSSPFLSSFITHFVHDGPFERRLIGVDEAALRRYNGKPNIFGPKIWAFFLTLEAFLRLSFSC